MKSEAINLGSWFSKIGAKRTMGLQKNHEAADKPRGCRSIELERQRNGLEVQWDPGSLQKFPEP